MSSPKPPQYARPLRPATKSDLFSYPPHISPATYSAIHRRSPPTVAQQKRTTQRLHEGRSSHGRGSQKQGQKAEDCANPILDKTPARELQQDSAGKELPDRAAKEVCDEPEDFGEDNAVPDAMSSTSVPANEKDKQSKSDGGASAPMGGGQIRTPKWKKCDARPYISPILDGRTVCELVNTVESRKKNSAISSCYELEKVSVVVVQVGR